MRLVNQIFISEMMVFSCNVLNVNSLKCVSMNNQECKVRPKIININSNEPSFYPNSIKINKSSGICDNMNDLYAKMCVPDINKNLNVRIFDLMSRISETRYIEWLETCKCKCRLDTSVCNNKQRWNNDKCKCEWKELIDKGICGKGFIWIPSNCKCECDKSCDGGEYLDYENCKCRKSFFDKLVDECSENIEEHEMIYNGTLNNHKNVCGSCAVYIILLSVFLTINFDSSLLKIDKALDIYYIGCITIKKCVVYESINAVNPFFLVKGEVDGYIEEKYGGK